MKVRHSFILLTILVALVVVTSCHTTSRLGEDEILYTGVKKLVINIPDSVVLPDGIDENIKTTIDVPANNSLMSPYVRSPFPIGLWLYNHWPDNAKGLKGWIYRKFAEEPVLMSDVRPDLRMKMVEDMLAKNGFFGSTTSYELLHSKKNHKKARVNYTVNISVPKRITRVIKLKKHNELDSLINLFARRNSAIRKGRIFSVDSLAYARQTICDRLRNRGYYYFRPEYLTFKADSTLSEHGIELKLEYAKDIPSRALRKYYVGKVKTYIFRNQGDGTPDTIKTERGDIICMRPCKLRKNAIASCFIFEEGDLMKTRNLSTTQSYLSRLGIFNSISVDVTPLDSIKDDRIDVNVYCSFNKPLETQLELNMSSKSNSYLGPGLSFAVSQRNMFGGGERLTVKLDAAYEWQIGKIESGKSRSDFNSYEIGLSGELAFPRLLAPKFLRATRRELSWTRINLGGDLMNRPHFFKMAQFNVGFGYDWMSSRYTKNQLNLFELKYNKLISTTPDFDKMMDENPSIALSFEDQFIAKAGYTFTFDRVFGRRRFEDKRLTVQASITEGGNLFSGIWSLAGVDGTKRLFGTPFSQFIKGTLQAVYSHRVVGKHRLVGRVFVGAAHAYGNSSEIPYTEQFYVGGANSLRAFAVRSIGPGSYHSEKENSSGYYDQTGTFRFEANLEYRFPIVGIFKGAVFLDAGNIWLLKDDELRPGAKLTSDFLKDLALGTGFGLRLDMGMIVVRGDLGIGLHLPYETGKTGYYNMPSFKKSLAFNLAIGYPF